jgi:hypothetical protein
MVFFGMAVSPVFFPANIYYGMLITTYSLSVATTVLSTLIIVLRILMIWRMPGASRQPRIGLALEIIVESAALYSISALVYIPMLGFLERMSAVTYYHYPQIFFDYMAACSYYLYVICFSDFFARTSAQLSLCSVWYLAEHVRIVNGVAKFPD